MIKLELKCYNGHPFQSSFRDEDAFTKLKADDHIACPSCGICDVQKDINVFKGVSAKDFLSYRPCKELSDKVTIQLEIYS